MTTPKAGADREASLRSSISVWTSLRRAWAEIALCARERGDREAAVQAEQELIHCELQSVGYVRELALLRDHAR
jgi:hypothetical protein